MLKPHIIYLVFFASFFSSAQDTSAVFDHQTNFILYQLDASDTLILDHGGNEVYHYHADVVMSPSKDTRRCFWLYRYQWHYQGYEL